MTEPLLICEDFVSFFKFWLAGRIQEGMRWDHELFCHCQTFDRSQQQQVYILAWRLAEHGVRVVITASQASYRVWVPLGTPPISLEDSPCPPTQPCDAADMPIRTH